MKRKKKTSSVRIFDFIIIFWSLMFLTVPFTGQEIPLEIKLMFLISGVSLIAYLIYVIVLRNSISNSLSKELKISEEIESKIFVKENNPFYQIKQQFLEEEIEIELIKQFPHAKVMKNVFIPTSSGKTTEIDLLLIDIHGIFIFEAKNISATLSGDWSAVTLKATYSNGNTYDIQNPVIQNSKHYEYLKFALGIKESNAFNNIVILGGQTEYDEDEYNRTKPGYSNLCRTKELPKKMYKLFNQKKFKKDEQWVTMIYENLKRNTVLSQEQKEKHNANINSMKEVKLH